jgi:hypothetical protein
MFTGDFIFKGLTARRLYKSFSVKMLISSAFTDRTASGAVCKLRAAIVSVSIRMN